MNDYRIQKINKLNIAVAVSFYGHSLYGTI